jgi:hypothetical protein
MPRVVTNINGTGTYNANDVVGKTLFAKTSVDVFNSPGLTWTEKLYTVQPGNVVGVVYSWVNRDGTIWWQLEPGNKFVEHKRGRFDLNALKEQGLETTQEKEEAAKEAAKPWYEKLFKTASQTIITVAVISVIGYGLFSSKNQIK